MAISQFQNKEWLVQQLTLFSIRDLAKQHNLAPASVRYWIKKHRLPKGDIRTGMLKKCEYISNYVSTYWSSPTHRQQMSKRLKEVQANRKKELSRSAKKNWKNNRASLITGIKKGTTEGKKKKISRAVSESWTEDRKAQQSRITSKLWRSDTYRQQHMGNTESFVEKAIATHGNNFKYHECEYNGANQKVIISCQCGHTFHQLPHNHLKGKRCPHCNISTGQREIYDFVSSLIKDIHLNDRNILAPHEVDLYIPAHKLGIEYHGLYWHSYGSKECTADRLRHQTKCNAAKDFQLLQIFDFEWCEKRMIIESVIMNKLHLSIKVPARKTKVAYLSNGQARNFFDTNHLAGFRAAKHTLALIYKNEIIMAMSLSKHGNGLEIIRMATMLGRTVQGGVSKLIKAVIEAFAPNYITTFADKRYANGNGYLAAGFALIAETKPNYFYYKSSQRLSRQQCQKHKLSKMLGTNFDPELTESENMFRSGFRRVWDAGHLKFMVNP